MANQIESSKLPSPHFRQRDLVVEELIREKSNQKPVQSKHLDSQKPESSAPKDSEISQLEI